MMIEAGFSQQDKRKFWCEVISTATKLDNIMVGKERTKPPYTLFYNDEPKYKNYLRSFGEMAVIAISDGKKMRSKLDTRGKTGIFVGYADDHPGNVYRFINIQTKQIILSRDIQWLNSFWKEYKKRKGDSKKLIDEFYSHGETFRQVITELRKKALHETTMVTGEKLDKNAYRESAMMCWESLDESEPTSKKRKTLCQEEATNDPSDKIDDDPHTQRTANKGVDSIIPVNDLQLGADDDASTLATQDTLAKNLVYVTNIPDGKLAHTDIARDSSKNSSEKDGKPSSLLEKPDQLIRKDTLNAYGTSKTNDKREKGKERTTNTWRTRKIIHTEFESDDDVAEPQKNAETTKKKGKVRVTTKTIHYYEFSSDEEDEAHADPKTNEKTHADHEKSTKKSENDQALVSNEMTPSTIGSDIFIGDSAATSHMTNNKTGVYDLKPIRGSVMIGNGESISCTHKGKLDVICKHKDGSTAKHTWEVKIVPQLNHDLFSFTKAMKEGWQMHGRWKEGGLMIELSQTSKNSIKFDRMIPSGSSWLMGLKTQRLVGQAHAVIEPGKSIPILKFHHITGHTGEHLLRPTAEYMGIKLTGKLEPCEMCAQAKITQANVPKKKEKQVPSRPGYRMFIDISSFKHESMGGKRHWLIVVDEFSDCSHSFFLKRKNDQIELFPDWIKELKAKYGIDIKYIRLDNSGENKGLKDECEKQNLGIIFEFTAPGTPQQNSVVERKLPTLMGRSRAMMLTAGFSQQDKRKFWSKYMKFLRSFGEMAVIAITDGKKMRSKLDPRGRTGIFVGYADDHAGNVYRFINTQTKKIILSRDVQWLNSFLKEYKKRKDDSRNLVDVFHSLEEDEQTQEESEVEEPNEQEIAETNDGNNTEEQKRLGIDIQMIGAREEELGRTRSQTREMMSPRNESMERAELTMEDWIQETCFISAVTSGPTEPKTFQEAWHSPIEEERHKWQAAIRKEIRSMINRGVWRKIDKMKIPENRRLIGNKWVFKIKRDGTYWARLVALGYSQIPGVDFTDNFAPVAHDVSFRIALARMMVEKLDSLVMDVETAFLYGDIEEEIFMKSPVGMEEIDPGSSPEDCFQLKKGIYGLCQAARQFWKKFVETIKKEPFGFTVSQADPCMLFKENNLGICIIIMYVDDMLVIGKKEQIQEFATMIQKEFSVKIQHNLADYLGCEFHMNKERTKGWLGQRSIIKSLEQKFGEKAMKTRSSLTPGTPRFIARRLENEEDKVNAQDHETYRSGVGTLLYLTKHSRPDISNPVRELSKTMDAPAPAHLKEMYKLIRFVLETQDHGLKFKLMKSIRKWVLKALSDSDFASDKETRISVFGYVIYFCGIPIAWRSKGMKSVVLSTTEAEYMALSEVVKELKFIVQLLQTMNITVELPITVYVDNVGAIWLSNNRNTGDRTKHIDIRTAFVKEYQEDGKIIIKFVKSEENDADIFTKNTSSIIYQKHQEKLVWDKKEVNDDQ